MKFFIKTFGCIQNTADSERIKAFYWNKGYKEVDNWREADLVVINTCIIRESAENRVYGLINEIDKWNRNPPALRAPSLDKEGLKKISIVVTGCLAGLANKDKTGKKLAQLKRDFPEVSEFLPIEKISYKIDPIRDKKDLALIPISFGCSNFCSYCIVPFARGPEISRPMEEILKEIDVVIKNGFKEVLLIGQNVNSYLNPKPLFNSPLDERENTNYVVHMGKKRLHSSFHILLEEVAKKDLQKISFVSSNPWDFSDELIATIAKYPNIDRLLHLPFQAGDDEVLKKMNRGYTQKEYLDLVKKIRSQISDVRFSTDIIIGFPGEDEKAFQNTVKLCKKAKFEIAYLNKYSPRKGTVSAKLYKDEIPQSEKKRRWNVLNDLINKK
ncbi:MAG: MiaB/RimO family radical SAM methylthiotransferase [Candidatus Shapirobacteria bacterium]|nr:MiaB/RimO family radical SAM methylthiotransferase [Candidatus Shapirobacteria bacterium]MDD4410726.1 MiaB/RimO family radical SAM methylthiotransferase [Candidatus Shapirobacteria bacterium]